MEFALAFIALYVGHHVGDYWVQTHHQATTKGRAGAEGVYACTLHVLSYVLTQLACLTLVMMVVDLELGGWGLSIGLLVSGLTHYTADRREYGLLFWLAERMHWKRDFLGFGTPRFVFVADQDDARIGHQIDQPTLGTGAHALDQSWHLVFSVFVPALIIAT